MSKKDKNSKKYLKIFKIIKAGKLEKALKQTDDIEDLMPIGIILSEDGKHEIAMKIFDKVIRLNPDYDKAWIFKGSELKFLEEYEESLKCINKAININPTSDIAWAYKGDTFACLGRYDEALECYDRAININSKNEHAWAEKSYILTTYLGRNEEALISYKNLININPKNELHWANKGKVLADLGRYEEALECYEHAIEINPKIEKGWSNKGELLFNLGRYDESLECLEKMSDINPNDTFILIAMYRLLIMRERFDEALEVVIKALNLNPNDERLWFDKGYVLFDLDRFDEALECYEQSININPNNPKAIGNIGIVFLEKREYDKAKDEFRKARELFNQINSKENAALAYNYERLTLNAAELLKRLEPLDKRFLNSLKCQSLVGLKSECAEISYDIDNIVEEFKKKELPDDVYALLWAKSICFNAVSKIINYEKIDENLLNKARLVFEKWKLDSFVIAVNSIDTFSRLISKYSSIDKIPRKNKEYIFENVLSTSYVLDGELTEKITDKIKGEPFILKPIKEVKHPDILMIIREKTSIKWAKAAIVQLDYSTQYIPQPYCHTLEEETKEEVKQKILSALKIAKEENVNIIAFPELSFTKDLVDKIKSINKDMIIICGSFYDEHKYNVCPIVINNDVLIYKKCHRSIIEEPNGEGMNKGNKIFIIQTKFGKISILNCVDFDEEFHRICKENIDVIINPRWDIDREHSFQKKADLQIDRPDGSRLKTFILHVNCMKAEWAGFVGGEGSCILGYEHRYRLEKYIRDGLRPNSRIKYKICEAKGEMICIASLKIGSITEKRVKMGKWFKYDSNEKRWNLLQDKGIWLDN